MYLKSMEKSEIIVAEVAHTERDRVERYYRLSESNWFIFMGEALEPVTRSLEEKLEKLYKLNEEDIEIEDEFSHNMSHVFKNVTPEILEKEYKRMKDSGELIEYKTTFGTFLIKKHPLADSSWDHPIPPEDH